MLVVVLWFWSVGIIFDNYEVGISSDSIFCSWYPVLNLAHHADCGLIQVWLHAE